MTSRTYSTVDGQPGTFGTGVPTIPLDRSMAIGETRVFGGIEDASTIAIDERRGGTFRTNFGLVSTSPAAVEVTVTMYFSHPATGRAVRAARDSVTRTYQLGGFQFLLFSRVASEMLGGRRDDFSELHDLEIHFAVTGGSGRVVPFVTSTDNGTNDTILRTE